MCQSSQSLHMSSHSLSRNDCSSGVSLVYLKLNSLSQSGRPRNISASHQTSPDSSTSRSVDDISGKTFLNTEKTKRVSSRSEEHTSELQSLMRISYAVLCLKKNTDNTT